MNESCYIYEWVMSPANESGHKQMRHIKCEWFSLHIHVTYERDVSYIWMHSVTHTNMSCHTYERAVSNISMRHVAHVYLHTHQIYIHAYIHVWSCHISSYVTYCHTSSYVTSSYVTYLRRYVIFVDMCLRMSHIFVDMSHIFVDMCMSHIFVDIYEDLRRYVTYEDVTYEDIYEDMWHTKMWRTTICDFVRHIDAFACVPSCTCCSVVQCGAVCCTER